MNVLYYDYALLFFFIGAVSSLIGVIVITRAINKYKRRSLVLWLMICFFGISGVLIIVASIAEIVQNVTFKGGWGFRDLCN
jgi:hypothetical protein